MILIFTIVLIILLMTDWMQTRFISKHPELFSEINIILGVHPSLNAVNLYFSICIVATVIFSKLSPETLAIVVCSALIILEGFVTIRNYKNGVRMTLP